MNTYLYTWTYIHTIKVGKEAMNLKEGEEVFVRGFSGRRG